VRPATITDAQLPAASRPATLSTSDSVPSATAITNSPTSSSEVIGGEPLMSRNTNVAGQASRLVPSMSGWLHASECRSTAALNGTAEIPLRPSDNPAA